MNAVDLLRLLGVDVFMPVGDGGGDLLWTRNGCGIVYNDYNGIGYDKHCGRGIGYLDGEGYGNGGGYGYGKGFFTVRLIRNRR